MRTVNPKALDSLMVAYLPALMDAVINYPNEYGFPPEKVPLVADKMRAAFERGSYNHDGRAIRAACKVIGIKHTRKAIEEYLTYFAP